MRDWEIHREVAIRLLKGVAVLFLVTTGVLLVVVFLGNFPLVAVSLVLIALAGVWYFEEYRKAKYRRDLRNRTGGTCG